MPAIGKRVILAVEDIDKAHLSELLDRLPVTPFRWFEVKDWLRCKIWPLSKEEAVEKIAAWAADELVNTGKWSCETGIPAAFSMGTWVAVDGSSVAGAEVKLGSNGGTYYCCEATKRGVSVFSME